MADTLQNKTTIKSWFETGDKPTQDQFDDLITTLVAEGSNLSAIAYAVEIGGPTHEATATGYKGSFAQGTAVTASGIGAWAIEIDFVVSP